MKNNIKIKTVSFEEIEDVSDGNCTQENFLNCQDKIGLYKKIQALNNDMREVIYLRLSSDLSFAEIGEIIGKSENWARVTFYRGKQQLMRR